jgi:hypothetical protein
MTGVQFPVGAVMTLFYVNHRVQTGSGALPASYPMGTEGKAAGLEADRSPPSCADVKNAWDNTSTPQYVFMALCLIKQEIRLCMVLSYAK